MADSANDTTSTATAGADEIQPYVDNAKETIRSILEEPDMDAFLREHIQKIPEWHEWSEPARQAYAHMMTSQMLQRKAAATQISIGHPFKLPAYSAIKNLGLLLQRKPLPESPKKKRKRKAAPAAEAAPMEAMQEAPTTDDAALAPATAEPQTTAVEPPVTEATSNETATTEAIEVPSQEEKTTA